MIFVVILLLILLAIIGCLFVNYYDAKRQCDTHIRFDTFTQLYSRFPQKWFLYSNYVELDVYKLNDDNDRYIGHSLRLYFKNPFDLIRYYFFYDKINRQKEIQREQMNQDYFVQAFRKLEEWEKKQNE